MVLDNVSQGDPHVSAHNAERAVINELDTNAIRKTLVNAKGDVIVATGNDAVTRVPVSASNGAVLIVDDSQPTGVRWSTGNDAVLSEANTNAVRKTLVDAKGDLLVGSADNTVVRVAGPTTDGKILIADAAQASGVRWSDGLYLRGSGFPEGVVTAPIGSRYIDTAATNGAVEWIKASGSGNTGWEVVYGDTGWRDISTLQTNGWTSTQMRVRRNGENIYFWFLALVATAATADTVLTLPDGFKPSFVQRFPILDTTVNRQLNVDSAGGVRVLLYTTGDGSLDACSAAWLAGTAAAPGNWPAVLPGVAV